jgi:high-affinity nickel-transport protein
MTGKFWSWVQGLDFGVLGFVLAGAFLAAWAVSFGIWKLLRPDKRPTGTTMDA